MFFVKYIIIEIFDIVNIEFFDGCYWWFNVGIILGSFVVVEFYFEWVKRIVIKVLDVFLMYEIVIFIF